MAAAAVVPLNHPHLSPITSFHRTSSLPLSSSAPSPAHYLHHPLSHGLRSTPLHPRTSLHQNNKHKGLRVGCSAGEPLKVMISGAPASGKGTQCEMITSKYGLVHISTGDLLRAEVSSGTDTGKKVKEYIENGLLVPDEIITDMVISRISQQDVRERGWLLDGYPRNTSQAQMLEKIKLRPHIFIMLDVPDEILIDRCVGRRLDPVTGRIYHIKSFPPETQEISARLITRADDTQEKVKSRLVTYKKYAQATSLIYSDMLKKVNGNRPKETVFEEIDSLLQQINVDVSKAAKSENFKVAGNTEIVKGIKTDITTSSQDNWRGIPTRLNNIPHSREIRKYFYSDVLQATQRAIEDKRSRLKVEINIPELNPEMDVYRIGTLMELVRTLALSFADDGKHVKICVQGSMGEGALAGMPLQLAGTRTILEVMDWGEYGAKGTFIDIGKIACRELPTPNIQGVISWQVLILLTKLLYISPSYFCISILFVASRNITHPSQKREGRWTNRRL